MGKLAIGKTLMTKKTKGRKGQNKATDGIDGIHVADGVVRSSEDSDDREGLLLVHWVQKVRHTT